MSVQIKETRNARNARYHEAIQTLQSIVNDVSHAAMQSLIVIGERLTKNPIKSILASLKNELYQEYTP